MGVCDFSSDGLLCSWVLIFHSLTAPASDFTLDVSCFACVCLLSCFGWGEDLFLPAPTRQVCVFDFFPQEISQLWLKFLHHCCSELKINKWSSVSVNIHLMYCTSVKLSVVSAEILLAPISALCGPLHGWQPRRTPGSCYLDPCALLILLMPWDHSHRNSSSDGHFEMIPARGQQLIKGIHFGSEIFFPTNCCFEPKVPPA